MKPVAWTDGKFCLSFAESDVCPIPLYTAPRELSDEEIIGAVARGWCSENNSSKTMDSDLAMAIVDEIKAILKKASEK